MTATKTRRAAAAAVFFLLVTAGCGHRAPVPPVVAFSVPCPSGG
jgi:hypothetical protein